MSSRKSKRSSVRASADRAVADGLPAFSEPGTGPDRPRMAVGRQVGGAKDYESGSVTNPEAEGATNDRLLTASTSQGLPQQGESNETDYRDREQKEFQATRAAVWRDSEDTFDEIHRTPLFVCGIRVYHASAQRVFGGSLK